MFRRRVACSSTRPRGSASHHRISSEWCNHEYHSDHARLLGGEVSRSQILCPGPGHSRNDRSLSSKSAALGYLFYSFAGDNPAEIFAHIRTKLGLPGKGFKPNGPFALPQPEDDIKPSDHADYAVKIWKESVDIKDTLAERYLRESRRLRLDGGVDWSRVIRFHKGISFGKRKAPAPIALYRDVLTDKPCAIQRIFLTKDGHKIARWMLGPDKNCAIKIDPHSAVSGELAIGEGLESALSGPAFGYGPAWACGSAGAIADFPLIPGVETLHIFAENDTGANEKAISECAERWEADGRCVAPVDPRDGCDDLNDEWVRIPSLPLTDRASVFHSIANKFWPGAEIVPHEDSPLSAVLKRIWYRAFIGAQDPVGDDADGIGNNATENSKQGDINPSVSKFIITRRI